MAVSEKRQKLFGGFNRLRDFPLDASALYDTKDELLEYLAENKTAFEGQIVVVKHGEGQGIYRVFLDEEHGLHLQEPLATGEDMIHSFEEIASLHNDITEHDQRILSNLEWITRISETYATKDELDDEIRKLLGDDYNNIKDELNSIYELSEQLDRVLVLLYEGLNGRTYSDIVSAVLTNLNDIRTLSNRLDATAATINSRIDADRARLDALESFQAHMTDRHILDVVNSQGLENVEYKESFYFGNTRMHGRFSYNNGFIITRANIVLSTLELKPESDADTYTVALKIANSDSYITEAIEFPIEETEISVDFPLINMVPASTGQIELVVSDNIKNSSGLVTVNYTRVPN